jgi:hypothetical protein
MKRIDKALSFFEGIRNKINNPGVTTNFNQSDIKFDKIPKIEFIWSSDILNNGKRHGGWLKIQKTTQLILTIRNDYLKNILNENISYVGGLLTLNAKKIKNREYKACWIEKTTGNKIKLVYGYIIKNIHYKILEKQLILNHDSNYCKSYFITEDILTSNDNEQLHFNENNYKKAVSYSKRMRKKSIKSLLEIKTKIKLERLSDNEYLEKIKGLEVSLKDSLNVGNCKTGTINFINKMINKLNLVDFNIDTDKIDCQVLYIYTKEHDQKNMVLVKKVIDKKLVNSSVNV